MMKPFSIKLHARRLFVPPDDLLAALGRPTHTADLAVLPPGVS